MKSIDKLRDAWQGIGGETSCAGCYYKIEDYINEIEDEIAECYQLLPVDADGIPIHLYDKLLKSTGAAKPTYDVVVGISDNSVFFNAEQGWESNWSKLTRHIKPRTLENIVADAIQYGHNGITGDRIEGKVAEFCAEIRELLGEGGVIDESDTIRNELADGGLIADALAPVCVDEKERRAFERGRVHERFAQQIFKEATS